MTVLAHLAGVPVEELLVPALACGTSGLALLARRTTWRRLSRRR